MKKHLLSVVAALSASAAFAQLPVSTAPQNKKAILEEFTGIYCGYCPDGHQIANAIRDADPENVILINIHSGPFAVVSPGEPDLTTSTGTSIDGMTGMGITGYPAGDINRRVFVAPAPAPESAGGMAGDRGNWASWASAVKSETAYCNVALEGHLDIITRVLTVEAHVYYTAASPVATNSLNVFLLEDAVNGPQHNYGTPYYNLANYNADGSYNHNHVLRKALTPTFGFAINTTAQGSEAVFTATYTVPQTYGAAGKTSPCQLGNLKLAAFVTESRVNTINGAHGPITMTGFTNQNDAGIDMIKSDSYVCASAALNGSFKFTNYGSDTITSADFDYGVDNNTIGSVSWSGSLPPMTTSQAIDIPTVEFLASQTNSLVIKTTDLNGGIVDQNPSNDLMYKEVPIAIHFDGNDLEMDFTQDQYGTESTWSVIDVVSNNVVASGGPYTNLNNAGTQLHVSTFSAAAGCYAVIVKDQYGDGINSGAGAGGYVLKAGSATLITSDGQFGAQDVSEITSATVETNTTVLVTGIANQAGNISGVVVYPNPANDQVNVSVSLSSSELITVSMVNLVGQEIYSTKQTTMNSGVNNVSINTQSFSTGVYFVKIASNKGVVNQKLIITK